MVRKKLDIDWSRIDQVRDIKPVINKYCLYLKDKGCRDSTIYGYKSHIKNYLEYVKTDRPTAEDASRFRDYLLARNVARSTLNNYSFAIKAYHLMHGESVELSVVKRNDEIPYYFDSDDVIAIFSACDNLKHYAMLQTLFYGCLRASELCGLDNSDIDLTAQVIRIRSGKGGRDAIIPIQAGCVHVLARYLDARPLLEVAGRYPLFYTDFGERWDRRDIWRMFMKYKKMAGIQKQGGVHVFARHTPATIMIANGCDIRVVQEVLRHRDIRTTLRYAHVSDKTKREKYVQYLKL